MLRAAFSSPALEIQTLVVRNSSLRGAFAHSGPYAFFIVISLRRVYQTITCADSLQHAAFALFGADEIYAVAQNRHFHAVIQ